MPAIQSYDEQELLLRMRQGDESAFTHIYSLHWELLYAIAYNRTKDIHLSQDIVQDVFTSLWSNRNRAEVHSLKSYLATAVKYMTLTHLRKSGQTILVEGHIGSEEAGHKTVEEQIDYKNLLSFLNDETDKLPDKCRLIFKYSRGEGLSVKEIASELNISPRTVETQLSKALRVLRKSLKVMFSWVF
ncbi:RNA polymerase sigma factor [Pinibacter soli]|uniref:RNA polymerase sigma-70 factor n=1 Tax=Pinibacter soli TaxID=3044211 RepID=A0ABT6RGF2_9BACT|nr:RNA polymerase sigma-70 factor [Pinibacter soli]MDI3321450.1 RNA polymerase sigma-70 factor [Pinibacter soli]